MAINRLAAETIIQQVPKKLRDAARVERKLINQYMKEDPVGHSFKVSHSGFEYSNNDKLRMLISEINTKISSEIYAQNKKAQQDMTKLFNSGVPFSEIFLG